MAPTKRRAGAISCLPMGGRGRGSEGFSLVGQCCWDCVVSSRAKEVVCMRSSWLRIPRANRGRLEEDYLARNPAGSIVVAGRRIRRRVHVHPKRGISVKTASRVRPERTCRIIPPIEQSAAHRPSKACATSRVSTGCCKPRQRVPERCPRYTTQEVLLRPRPSNSPYTPATRLP
jgi:hypothetical protein